ncbi:MAG: heparin lyase I family protein, partial [Myxococcota bacterium]
MGKVTGLMKGLFYILFIFPLIAMPQANAIIFDTPFESSSEMDGTSDAWRDDVPGNNSSWTLVTGQLEGNTAIRLANDPNLDRNELVKQRIIDWNVEYWLGFAFKVVEKVNGNEILFQLRSHPDNSQNPVTITSNTSTSLSVKLSTDETYANQTTPATGAESGTESFAVDYVIGEWQVFVFNFVLSPTSGRITGWHNGAVFVDETGTTVYGLDNNGDPKEEEEYLKIGTYAGPNVSPREGEVHYDAFKLWEGSGGSYEAVSPLGLSPTNNPGTLIKGSNLRLNGGNG